MPIVQMMKLRHREAKYFTLYLQRKLLDLLEICLETQAGKFFLFLKNKFIYLFIYFWLRWVFVAVHGLSELRRAGAILCCGVWISHCGGFSCHGAWASVVVACGLSSCGSGALEHRLSSCGSWA